jgi:GNAT superfamily N-acetyltransferase
LIKFLLSKRAYSRRQTLGEEVCFLILVLFDEAVVHQASALFIGKFAHGKRFDDATGGLQEEIKRLNCSLLYATESSVVTGYIVYKTNSLNCHIGKVAVNRKYRRKGIGSALVKVRPPPFKNPTKFLAGYLWVSHVGDAFGAGCAAEESD